MTNDLRYHKNVCLYYGSIVGIAQYYYNFMSGYISYMKSLRNLRTFLSN